MLHIGDAAPPFSLQDQHGETRHLEQLLADGPAVVYFYPADFTPVCTREACAFRDSVDDWDNVAVPVVGISPQSVDSHRRFAEQFRLPFPLLSDPRKTVIRAWGVDGPLGIGVRRVTFLIGPERRVLNRVVADFFVGDHLKLVKEAIEAAPGGAE